MIWTFTDDKIFVQCFLQSDLLEGRPSSGQYQSKLPWFLAALPCADYAKGGHGAYTTSLDLAGTISNYHPCHHKFTFGINDANSLRKIDILGSWAREII